MLQKSRNGAKSVLVVLDGYKVSKEKNGGHAPLLWALHDAGLVEKDEVVVLAVFNLHEQTTSPDTGSVCCLLRENKTCHSPSVDHLKLLQEEIISKMEKLTDIFKSFHEACKTNDVKFMLKIAADYQPRSIIINEANCAGAKWIVMDRCFADDNGFQLNEIECITLVSLVLVSDSEQLVLHNCPPPKPKLTEDPHIYRTLPHLVFDNQPFKSSSDQASTSTQAENLIREETEICPSRVLVGATSREIAKVNNALGFSLQLSSWEAILEITSDFKDINGRDQNENFQMFRGYIPIYESEALVKTFSSNLGSILDAEKMIAVSMHHKNILRFLGYHQTANAISLAFPFPAKGTLERFLHGAREKQWQLTFYDKLNIVIGISRGLSYMHAECPQGPVAHGDLKMSNIYLRYDLQPQITGFGHAIWLQQEQSSSTFYHSCLHRHQLDPEMVKIMKTDIFSFGILILRLFCRRTLPQENRVLIKWAQPLLSSHAYHEMLDEEEECPDMYGMLRVMHVAAQCIKPRHASRPSMSKVVSYLKGETSFTAEASPMLSDSNSPSTDLRSMSPVIRC
ncbi:Protein kinase domain-containing protein [Heracleum sosnowskyi]|uniref:Protein kinase domain-containing protein n=1 Tax=Heracleum sosnowskyi TaxID=360622 RepID=A0AAD8J8F7_9APIA|nr:Protein kinase domain-containing protein [Heracleum sosnowskyi]